MKEHLLNANSILDPPEHSIGEKQEGRWNKEEHQRFLEGIMTFNIGIELYGRNWKKIEEYIRTRNSIQIRSHAQKHFKKLHRRAAKSLNKQVIIPEKKNVQEDTLDEEKKLEELGKHVSSIMIQITAAEDISDPTRRIQFLNSFKKECNDVSDKLYKILPQILIGTLVE